MICLEIPPKCPDLGHIYLFLRGFTSNQGNFPDTGGRAPCYRLTTSIRPWAPVKGALGLLQGSSLADQAWVSSGSLGPLRGPGYQLYLIADRIHSGYPGLGTGACSPWDNSLSLRKKRLYSREKGGPWSRTKGGRTAYFYYPCGKLIPCGEASLCPAARVLSGS